mgnify:CR=1 FL=1|tara:strand:+ start:1067 stop:3265 length:2199 start_codon:yes stop_codon:yes gene_type:complete
MKIFFYRLSIVIFLGIFSFAIYLSTIGIKTDRFNNQISAEVKKINDQLELDLNEIGIFLNLFKLQLTLKTLGVNLKNNDKTIKFESVSSNINIKKMINGKFSPSEVNISTKSLEIKNLISFIRSIENNPQLFILEKFVKKGYLIADIILKFDEQGKLKENYIIKGLVKDGEIKKIKNINLSKINFLFNLERNLFNFNDIQLSLNDKNLLFPKLNIKNKQNKFLISGKNINNNVYLKENEIYQFLNKDLIFPGVISTEFDLDNNFSFSIDKKYQVKDLKVDSSLNLKKMNFTSKISLKKYFPEINNELILTNQKVQIQYKKNFLSVKGKGNIILQKEIDDIEYDLTKSKKDLKFNTLLKIKKNPMNLDFLNFQKGLDSNLEIILTGNRNLISKETIFKKILFKEKNNILELKNLRLSKDPKIISIDKIDLDYLDLNLLKNKLSISRKNKDYDLVSESLNASKIIDDLLKPEKKLKNEKNFLSNFKLNINVNETYLDKDHTVDDLYGYLSFKDGEIIEGDLSSSFSKNEKIKLTIRSIPNEKITTFYSDIAKPFVNRYEFINGFEEGNLNFHSVKKNNISNSKLIIDNFKVQEVPALAKLLTLASLQGIADLLTGEGIRFSDFEMTFSNKNNLLTIEELYAIGPAISILMNGYIEKNELVSLRGTLVPATTINRTISSIPLIGNILVGKKVGEGVFGVSFKIKGPPKKLKTSVNPVKTLTPRFITRTLEKLKKN